MISNFHMPGMNDLELVRAVRKRHPHLVFLMATGADVVHFVLPAMNEGADNCRLKPLGCGVRRVTLDQDLNRKRLEAEVESYLSNLEERIKEGTHQLQAALAAALDRQDSETVGHSRRVTGYCLEIARALGCDQAEKTIIASAARLHDIGKIGIPDAIMLKPGPLTDRERLVMESHVKIGYDLLSNVAFLARSADIVLAHHERFDGAGYPRRLRGAEIPLGARILAVADTLGAMTSDRPYRRALPYRAAREESLRVSGHQFDPAVVAAFLSIGESTWDAIREGNGARTVA